LSRNSYPKISKFLFYLNLHMNFFTFIFYLFSLQFTQTFISQGLHIRFRSIHLVLWSLENLIVCESPGKGLVVQEKDASPQVHLT
jgi:hypothetical protein